MRHPFELTSAELENLELDFGELLTDEEAAQVGGGGELTTRALGEEGVRATTLALGEEGGGGPLPYTSHALGEEGGGGPFTILALGEED